MNGEDTKQMRNMLLFISGMGVLGLILALLLFGEELFAQSSPEDELASINIDETLSQAPVVESIGQIGVGSTAPDFTLVDLDGTPHTLDDFKGRPVIVNFWATWCAPCRIEMPELQETFENYSDEDLVILAVNREETPETVEGFFINEMQLTFTPLLDSSADVANAYGVFNMPTTFFVDESGTVTAVHRGPMTLEVIDGYLAQTIQ
ncbi:MAG: redoxin domain-containing protein [Ardenticatenaceae bacterium]|nr:redoxin domain-containing protein [Ardenticatenaceae bacterium]